jgi:hypothetical protein
VRPSIANPRRGSTVTYPECAMCTVTTPIML